MNGRPASFAALPSALAEQCEASSNRFKTFLHSLQRRRRDDGGACQRPPTPPAAGEEQVEIREYLHETRLWPNQFVYIHDVKTGRFHHRGFADVLGYDLDRLTPDFFAGHVHPADLITYFKVAEALLDFVMQHSPDLVPFESSCHVYYRLRRKDGGYASILRKSTPFLKDDDGQVRAYISRCTDIGDIGDEHRVKWKIFGPKSEHFSDFLEPLEREPPGSPLFTEREMDVLRLLRDGLTSAEIAEELYISVNTVNTHRKSLMRKAEVGKTVDLLFFAQEHDYL